MAKRIHIQKNRNLRGRRNFRDVLGFIVKVARERLVAYVVIAFAISFGFHILEVRTDRQIEKSIRSSCQRENGIRDQINQSGIIIKNSKIRLKLDKVNCNGHTP